MRIARAVLSECFAFLAAFLNSAQQQWLVRLYIGRRRSSRGCDKDAEQPSRTHVMRGRPLQSAGEWLHSSSQEPLNSTAGLKRKHPLCMRKRGVVRRLRPSCQHVLASTGSFACRRLKAAGWIHGHHAYFLWCSQNEPLDLRPHARWGLSAGSKMCRVR